VSPPFAVYSRGLFALVITLPPLPALASNEDPDVIANHVRHEGAFPFAFIHGNIRGVVPAGTLHWEIPTTVLATGGLERKFDSYSADPLLSLRVGNQYKYDFGPLGRPEVLRATPDEAGKELAARKVRYVHELYGRYYPDPQKSVAELPEIRAAFQIALWELICETDVPDGPMPFHLYTGTFRADYPEPTTAPAPVQLAQEYVQSLTGNDQPFYDHPLFGGSEIVRLDGLGTTTTLTTAVNVPRRSWFGNGCCVCECVTYDVCATTTTTTEYAQSQLVVRLASGVGDASRGQMFNEGVLPGGSGGGVLSGGVGGGRPFGTSAFPGFPGGFPTGGPGAGFAAPGLIGTPGGFVSNPTDSTPPVGTPPTSTPPVSVPPLGEERTPPGGDNPTPGLQNFPPPGVDNPPPGINPLTNPPQDVDNTPPAVPAPPGVIVGLVAVGVLAVRQRLRR
jgi:hypothetical protein